MDRRLFSRAGLGAFAAMFATSARAASDRPRRVVFQVSTGDRRDQTLALGNAHNYAAHYKAKGEACQIEIVAFGPGFSMVRGDMSMMKGEVENLQRDLGASLKIVACHNTRQALAESEGKKPADIPLLPGVGETPSGVVRIAALQDEGWAYIRP